MALAAAIPGIIKAGSSLLGLFGSRPRAVPVDPTDPQAVARDTLAGNRALLPEAQGFADDLTAGMQLDANRIVEQAMPGFTQLRDSLVSRAQEAIDNPYDVPAEVQENLGRLAAERGISTGGRGQFADFSALRDFGMNALAFGDARLSQAQSLFSLARQLSPVVNPVSPLAFLPTTEQALNVDLRNKANKQAVAQADANARSAQRNDQLGSIGESFGAFAGLLQNLPLAQSNNPAASGVEATTRWSQPTGKPASKTFA